MFSMGSFFIVLKVTIDKTAVPPVLCRETAVFFRIVMFWPENAAIASLPAPAPERGASAVGLSQRRDGFSAPEAVIVSWARRNMGRFAPIMPIFGWFFQKLVREEIA